MRTGLQDLRELLDDGLVPLPAAKSVCVDALGLLHHVVMDSLDGVNGVRARLSCGGLHLVGNLSLQLGDLGVQLGYCGVSV